MVDLDTSGAASANADTLERELTWLGRIIDARLSTHFGGNGAPEIREIRSPEPGPGRSLYASILEHYEMDFDERLVLILALAAHVRPRLLDAFFRRHDGMDRGHTEFGGIHGRAHGGFLPTGETAVFLLAGDDLGRRFEVMRLFDRDHYFARHGILKLEPPAPGEPVSSGPLVLADPVVDLLTLGEAKKPDYSRDFPAQLLSTEMEWDDLVLARTTREQLREIEAWVRHEPVLMGEWGLERRLRPGYRCLFHGPPGTGKTLTATLLGRRVGRDVYRIALSAVVSKYIGETEKNLERIFTRAEHLPCILFFDEADALFGKRTNVSDAHDRYANQEVAYLLQRIEEFPGIVILASNLSSNIDEAFMRRFQAVVHFPVPDAELRRRLWAESLPRPTVLDESVTLDELAGRHELSGGAIMNVVRYASLMALDAGSDVIRRGDLIDGIRRELHKDGKTL
jgi:AAA+ superfamily predicted ATPase